MGTTNSAEANLGSDVQIIREILFGEQAKSFQQRIEALEEETRQLRKALADESKTRQRDNAASEERLKLLIAELTKQLENTDQSQTKALGELRTSNEAARSSDLKKQNELLVSLMAALETFKQYIASDTSGND
jgi:Sec-independent protein translocase protein TatA